MDEFERLLSQKAETIEASWGKDALAFVQSLYPLVEAALLNEHPFDRLQYPRIEENRSLLWQVCDEDELARARQALAMSTAAEMTLTKFVPKEVALLEELGHRAREWNRNGRPHLRFAQATFLKEEIIRPPTKTPERDLPAVPGIDFRTGKVSQSERRFLDGKKKYIIDLPQDFEFSALVSVGKRYGECYLNSYLSKAGNQILKFDVACIFNHDSSAAHLVKNTRSLDLMAEFSREIDKAIVV